MFRKILMDDLDRRDFIQGSESCPLQPTEGREDRAAPGSPDWQGKACSSRHLMTRKENGHKRRLLALVHVLQHIKTSELEQKKVYCRARRRVARALKNKTKQNPTSQKGFSKSPGGGRWGVRR